MRMLAALNHLADVGDARRAKQLLQLGELLGLAVGQRGDHVCTLTRPSSRALSIGGVRRRGLRAAAATTLHKADGNGSRRALKAADALDGLEQPVIRRRQRDPEE